MTKYVSGEGQYGELVQEARAMTQTAWITPAAIGMVNSLCDAILALEAERTTHLQTIGDLQAERDTLSALLSENAIKFSKEIKKAEARYAELEKALERARHALTRRGGYDPTNAAPFFEAMIREALASLSASTNQGNHASP